MEWNWLGAYMKKRKLRRKQAQNQNSASSIDTPIYQTMPEQYQPGQSSRAPAPTAEPAPKHMWPDAKAPAQRYKPTIVQNVVSPKVERISLLSEEAVAQGFAFRRKSGTVRITNYHGDKDRLVLPARIDGFPVNEIAAGAFAGNHTVRHLEIPESVRKIGAGAFRESALECCLIAGAIVELPDAAFEKCMQLGEVQLPGTLVRIGKYAFGECKSLHSIAFPHSCRVFGDHAFRLSGLSEFSVTPGGGVNNGLAFCHTPLHKNYDLVLNGSDAKVMEVLLCGRNVQSPMQFPTRKVHIHRGALQYCGTGKFDFSDCISVKIEPDAFLSNIKDTGFRFYTRCGTHVVLPLRCEPTAFPDYVKATYLNGTEYRQNVLRTDSSEENTRILTRAESIGSFGIWKKQIRKLTVLQEDGQPLMGQKSAIACVNLEHCEFSALSPDSEEMLYHCHALRSMVFTENGETITKYIPGSQLIGALQSELLPAFRGTGSHFFDRTVIDKVFRRGTYLDAGGRVRELSQKQRLLIAMDVLRSTRRSHELDVSMYEQYLRTHKRYAALLCRKLQEQYPEYAVWLRAENGAV